MLKRVLKYGYASTHVSGAQNSADFPGTRMPCVRNRTAETFLSAIPRSQHRALVLAWLGFDDWASRSCPAQIQTRYIIPLFLRMTDSS